MSEKKPCEMTDAEKIDEIVLLRKRIAELEHISKK